MTGKKITREILESASALWDESSPEIERRAERRPIWRPTGTSGGGRFQRSKRANH